MKKIYLVIFILSVIIFSCKEDAVNHLPEANDDTNSTTANNPVNGEAQANDVASEDGGNIWSLVGENGGAENGTVTMNGSGNYTYTPDLNWYGTDVINYQLCDNNGDCVEATITITVNPVILTLSQFNNIGISALALDGTNKLWIASNSGLYKEVNEGYLLVGLGSNSHVTALTYENSSNTIWAGTENGIYKVQLGESIISGDSISANNLSNNHILSIYIDENSTRWIATKTGFTRNEGTTWQKDKFKKNASGSITDITFSSKAVTSIGIWEGDYFFSTAGYKLWRTTDWDETVDAFTGASMWDPPYNGMAITDTMYAVFIDSRGLQWFGGQEGVLYHSGHDPKTDNQSFKNELINKNVHCIAEDPNGNIWCGTENGISIFNGTNWSTPTATLSNNFVNAIVFQGNKAWIGTKMGINKIDL